MLRANGKTSQTYFCNKSLSLGNRSTAKGSSTAAAVLAALSDPFNADGVVENPAFSHSRTLGQNETIAVTLTAHAVDGEWIAASDWHSTQAPFYGDGSLPSRKSEKFKTKSEAVGAALNRTIRQVETQLAENAYKPSGKAQLQSLRSWAAKAIADIRAADATLPLRGITVIEAFAGFGAASQALVDLGAKPLLVIENNEAVLNVYQNALHAPEVHKDILDFNGKGRKCDVFVLGAVCTAHSKAGNGKGMKDDYVGPVHEAALRAVRDIDFKVAIIECAPELLSEKHSGDAQRWRKALMARNCRVQHRTLNAIDFGLPQNRDRSFIVATPADLNVDDILGYVFPKAMPKTATVADILDKHVTDDQHLGAIDLKEVEFFKGGATKSPKGLIQLGLITGKKGQGYRLYDPKGVGPTMTAKGGGRARCTGAYLIDGKPRGLTAREACRMQGLPEWFEHDQNLARAQQQAGNALALPLFRELGRQLASVLTTRT